MKQYTLLIKNIVKLYTHTVRCDCFWIIRFRTKYRATQLELANDVNSPRGAVIRARWFVCLQLNILIDLIGFRSDLYALILSNTETQIFRFDAATMCNCLIVLARDNPRLTNFSALILIQLKANPRLTCLY